MCGIVGYIGCGNAVDVLMNGLKTLEYRGYDSAGLALSEGKSLQIYKASGKLDNLKNVLARCEQNQNAFNAGIGHIRWATHGRPTVENAHPHVSDDGQIALVHNGIIENYAALKEELTAKGYSFYSQTDTETAVKLIEDCYKSCHDLEKAVVSAVHKLRGAFAFCIMHRNEPDKIIAVRKSAPLIIGLKEKESFIASDVPALAGKAHRVIYLDDGEIVVVKGGEAAVKDFNGVVKVKPVQTLDLQAESLDKRGCKHFMLKEIMEQPDILRRLLNSEANKDVLNPFEIHKLFDKINRIEIIACGTSLHAASAAKAVIEDLCALPVEVTAASEYIYKKNLTDCRTLCIGISQSGETADTITALKQAKEAGAKILAVTNRPHSNIVRCADAVLYLEAGIEVSVAATKSYTAQLTVLYLLALFAAADLGRINDADFARLHAGLSKLPPKMEAVISLKEDIRTIAERFAQSRNYIYIARGINLATAAEGALKLKEISYINAAAYPAGELKHGPIALLDENMPVVALLVPNSPSFPKVLSNCEEAKARHAKLIGISGAGADLKDALFDEKIIVPEVEEIFSPLLYVLLLQLLAYYTADYLGREVDQPRNLAKSVTVE